MRKIAKDKDIDKEAASKFVGSLAKKVNQLAAVTMTQLDEFMSLKEAEDYLGRQLGCAVVVEKESESKSGRAGRAMPLKPSLDITFE